MGDPSHCEIRFEPSGARIRVPAGTSLLEAARLAGLPVASACGADGICARCGLEILEGAVAAPSEREQTLKQRNRIHPQMRLACRIRLCGDLTVTAPYW
jgi:adenylate cyclase